MKIAHYVETTADLKGDIAKLESDCRAIQDAAEELADTLKLALKLEMNACMDCLDAGHWNGHPSYDAAAQNVDRFRESLEKWYSMHGFMWSMDVMGNETKIRLRS